ncbi:ABC transporter ATP-binding protein [Salipiger mucosus]|uniref:Oligopeptide transport ATP-binding protein OppD n=1 Tax=Salipiger mucosus DSM 16094 TaxID=1123237 RepID=S9RR89_9RHOB|nr:ABC transporter ATP-binding protein [Salipiger mucosus]EPX80540.1 Oligopeptide transport ATP-binding protein OppD [Salipiger mucosus DSM 16094]
MTPVLDIKGLTTEFRVKNGWHAAVRGIDLSVNANETLAVVGESGSGKSVTALSTLRLLPQTGARISRGEVGFGGRDLTKLSEREMSRIRGNDIAMIFQEPMTSLNPTMTVGDQIAEGLLIHRGMSRTEAAKEARRLLDEVRVPDPARRVNDYPHQFSGGMRQRAMIAIALACRPKLLLADEPTTALDVTVQAQVLSLLDDLKRDRGMAIVFITHNLGVVAQIADRVAVMYAGEIVETATCDTLFADPVHPYTEALLKAMPRVDRKAESLEPIPGSVPSISARPAGCVYAPRCNYVQPSCAAHPSLVPVGGNHEARCPVRADKGEAA